MKEYIHILGQSEKLSLEEIDSIIGNIQKTGSEYCLVKTNLTPQENISNLGGTIKIAEYITTINSLDKLKIDDWIKYLNIEYNRKLKFGFSIYNGNKKQYIQLKKKALQLKKTLKEQGRSVRLVTGKEQVLSSVIVSKNSLIDNELIIVQDKGQYILGITKAVQDFEEYSKRDMERPAKDSASGMLPPKIAKIMINLSGSDRNKNILDPFCGSGTVLQEAGILNYKKIYGSDKEEKAVQDSKENIQWLKDTFSLDIDVEINKINIHNLSQKYNPNSIDIVVTEPFMGNARWVQKQNNINNFLILKKELQELYTIAFKEFKKIVKKNGKIIFIFPVFSVNNNDLHTLDKDKFTNLGFKLKKDIIYHRQGQKVKRQITVWDN